MRQIERTEYIIEAAGKSARGPLHMQAHAGIAHLMSRGERQFMAG